ncbi:hypothetical protein [Bartonella bacilliformis]|uniref:hypothetical protein n=1 Tax=Bartonella bacilliformis TaxID=774 RepID=UPI0039E5F835
MNILLDKVEEFEEITKATLLRKENEFCFFISEILPVIRHVKYAQFHIDEDMIV